MKHTVKGSGKPQFISRVEDLKEQKEVEEIGYKCGKDGGNPIAVSLTDKMCCCGKLGKKYLIKVDENGFLYSPFGSMSENTLNTKSKKIAGKKQYEFVEVSQESFEMYLRFLKSRNEATLRNVEKLTRN